MANMQAAGQIESRPPEYTGAHRQGAPVYQYDTRPGSSYYIVSHRAPDTLPSVSPEYTERTPQTGFARENPHGIVGSLVTLTDPDVARRNVGAVQTMSRGVGLEGILKALVDHNYGRRHISQRAPVGAKPAGVQPLFDRDAARRNLATPVTDPNEKSGWRKAGEAFFGEARLRKMGEFVVKLTTRTEEKVPVGATTPARAPRVRSWSDFADYPTSNFHQIAPITVPLPVIRQKLSSDWANAPTESRPLVGAGQR